MLSCGSTGTTAASDAHPASDPLPGVTGYRTPRSGSTIRRLPGRGGPPQFPPPPSIRSAPHTPGSPSRLRFQALRRFHGLRPDFGGSALPVPARRRDLERRRRLRVMLRTASSLPLTGLLTLGSGPARFQAEPPACYRASWQLPGPDFHRQATTSLRTRRSTTTYVTASPPALLDAHNGLLSLLSASWDLACRGNVATTVFPGSPIRPCCTARTQSRPRPTDALSAAGTRQRATAW